MLTGARLVAFAATVDLDRSHAFYGDVLGLRRVEASPFANGYDVAGTPLRVTLVEAHVPAPFTVLGWQVPDVDGAVASLVSKGVRFNRYPGTDQDAAGAWTSPSGARVAWFQDPDGNVLSVTQLPAVDA